MSLDLIKSLIEAYRSAPQDPTAIANLSLIPLGLAIAEWGVFPTGDLPKDPAKKDWSAVEGTGDGKHLMSYSKGGIGIMHLDSGKLARLMDYIEENNLEVVPNEYKSQFYSLKGVNYDKLYAAGGHCTKPISEIRTDLSGSPFLHTYNVRYAGDNYCRDHLKPALKLTPKDWQIFRHGMREALRHEDIQFRIIREFANTTWASAYRLVVLEGGHDVSEAFVIARIWNSSASLARCVFAEAGRIEGKEARMKIELNSYAANGPTRCKGSARMRERWPYMRRAVEVYDHLLNSK